MWAAKFLPFFSFAFYNLHQCRAEKMELVPAAATTTMVKSSFYTHILFILSHYSKQSVIMITMTVGRLLLMMMSTCLITLMALTEA